MPATFLETREIKFDSSHCLQVALSSTHFLVRVIFREKEHNLQLERNHPNPLEETINVAKAVVQ
jgi:ligand-binding sensor domain-containing protein